MKNIIKTLNKLGLTEKEARVYLASLELGPAKVSDIAKKSGVKRTTVYVVIEFLIKKGLISYYQSKKTKKYIAEEPQRLTLLLKEKQDALRHIMPQLQALAKTEIAVRPQIRFYQGRKACLTISEQTLEVPNSEVLYIGSMKDLHRLSTKEYDYNHYIPTRLKKKIKFRGLLFKDRAAEELKQDEKKYLREIKFLPRDFFFESSMFVYQDKIAFLSSKKELIGVTIQSEDLSSMEKQKFEMLWKMF